MPANFVVPVVLALFVPATWACLRVLGPVRGVIACLLGGWMFLPVYDGRVDVPILTTKMTLVPTTILLVSVLVDFERWRRLRLHPIDLAPAVLAIGPFLTALSNGLGPYEGLSAALQTFCAWGSPWLLGRVYLGAPGALRELARYSVGAALLYVPLCLWEIRMSPQLHRQLYGFHTFESFAFVVRFGGYRPTVFMQFGLMVGTFMATGTLLAWWLWRTRTIPRVLGLPIGPCTALLLATTVLVKSTGAVILLAIGIATLELTRKLRRPWIVLALALVAPAYVTARLEGWDGAQLAELAARIEPERGQSVGFRLWNEQQLVNRAEERPWLGWGRFGRSRVRDEDGRDISVTDSLWVISVGTTGLVGLCALGTLLVAPALLLMRHQPARRWAHPALAPAAAIAVGELLWVVDCTLNAMTTPIFPAMTGALATFAVGRWAALGRRVPAGAGQRSASLPPPAPAGP